MPGIRVTLDARQAIQNIDQLEARLARLAASVARNRQGLGSLFGGQGGSGGGAGNIINNLQQLNQLMNRTQQSAGGLSGTLTRLFGVFLSFQAIASVTGAIIDFSDKIVKATILVQKLDNVLLSATGSASGVAESWKFLTAESDRLGTSLEESVKWYGQLIAASKGSGIKQEDIDTLYTGISEAATALHMSTSEYEGAMRALTQVISKGKVQAEELRGQLGERIPGAWQLAADAMGVTSKELQKMMETGKLYSEDFIPKFAKQLRARFAGPAEVASDLLQAQLNRIRNSFFKFIQDMAHGDIGELVTEMARGIAETFDDPSKLKAFMVLLNELADAFKRNVGDIDEFTEKLLNISYAVAQVGGAGAELVMGIVGNLIDYMDTLSIAIEPVLRKLREFVNLLNDSPALGAVPEIFGGLTVGAGVGGAIGGTVGLLSGGPAGAVGGTATGMRWGAAVGGMTVAALEYVQARDDLEKALADQHDLSKQSLETLMLRYDALASKLKGFTNAGIGEFLSKITTVDAPNEAWSWLPEFIMRLNHAALSEDALIERTRKLGYEMNNINTEMFHRSGGLDPYWKGISPAAAEGRGAAHIPGMADSQSEYRKTGDLLLVLRDQALRAQEVLTNPKFWKLEIDPKELTKLNNEVERITKQFEKIEDESLLAGLEGPTREIKKLEVEYIDSMDRISEYREKGFKVLVSDGMGWADAQDVVTKRSETWKKALQIMAASDFGDIVKKQFEEIGKEIDKVREKSSEVSLEFDTTDLQGTEQELTRAFRKIDQDVTKTMQSLARPQKDMNRDMAEGTQVIIEQGAAFLKFGEVLKSIEKIEEDIHEKRKDLANDKELIGFEGPAKEMIQAFQEYNETMKETAILSKVVQGAFASIPEMVWDSGSISEFRAEMEKQLRSMTIGEGTDKIPLPEAQVVKVLTQINVWLEEAIVNSATLAEAFEKVNVKISSLGGSALSLFTDKTDVAMAQIRKNTEEINFQSSLIGLEEFPAKLREIERGYKKQGEALQHNVELAEKLKASSDETERNAGKALGMRNAQDLTTLEADRQAQMALAMKENQEKVNEKLKDTGAEFRDVNQELRTLATELKGAAIGFEDPIYTKFESVAKSTGEKIAQLRQTGMDALVPGAQALAEWKRLSALIEEVVTQAVKIRDDQKEIGFRFSILGMEEWDQGIAKSNREYDKLLERFGKFQDAAGMIDFSAMVDSIEAPRQAIEQLAEATESLSAAQLQAAHDLYTEMSNSDLGGVGAEGIAATSQDIIARGKAAGMAASQIRDALEQYKALAEADGVSVELLKRHTQVYEGIAQASPTVSIEQTVEVVESLGEVVGASKKTIEGWMVGLINIAKGTQSATEKQEAFKEALSGIRKELEALSAYNTAIQVFEKLGQTQHDLRESLKETRFDISVIGMNELSAGLAEIDFEYQKTLKDLGIQISSLGGLSQETQAQFGTIVDGAVAMGLATEEAGAKFKALDDRTGFLTDVREKMQALAREDALVKMAKESAQAWDEFAQNVEKGLSDAFYDIFTAGADGFRELLDQLKQWFVRFLADLAAQAIAKPIILPLVQGGMDKLGIGGSVAKALGLPSDQSGGNTSPGSNLFSGARNFWNKPMFGYESTNQAHWAGMPPSAAEAQVPRMGGFTWGKAMTVAGGAATMGYGASNMAKGNMAGGALQTVGGGLMAASAFAGPAAPYVAAAGAVLSVAGSLFGGGKKKQPYVTSWFGQDNIEKKGEFYNPDREAYSSKYRVFTNARRMPDKEETKIEKAFTDYYENFFESLEDQFNLSAEKVSEMIASRPFTLKIKPGEGDSLEDMLKQAGDEFMEQYADLFAEATLGKGSGEIVNKDFLTSVQTEGESLTDTFLRVATVLDAIPDGLQRIRDKVAQGMDEATAFEELEERFTFVSGWVTPAVDKSMAEGLREGGDFRDFKRTFSNSIRSTMKESVTQAFSKDMTKSLIGDLFDPLGGLEALTKTIAEGGDITPFLEALEQIGPAVDKLAPKFKEAQDAIDRLGKDELVIDKEGLIGPAVEQALSESLMEGDFSTFKDTFTDLVKQNILDGIVGAFVTDFTAQITKSFLEPLGGFEALVQAVMNGDDLTPFLEAMDGVGASLEAMGPKFEQLQDIWDHLSFESSIRGKELIGPAVEQALVEGLQESSFEEFKTTFATLLKQNIADAMVQALARDITTDLVANMFEPLGGMKELSRRLIQGEDISDFILLLEGAGDSLDNMSPEFERLRAAWDKLTFDPKVLRNQVKDVFLQAFATGNWKDAEEILSNAVDDAVLGAFMDSVGDYVMTSMVDQMIAAFMPFDTWFASFLAGTMSQAELLNLVTVGMDNLKAKLVELKPVFEAWWAALAEIRQSTGMNDSMQRAADEKAKQEADRAAKEAEQEAERAAKEAERLREQAADLKETLIDLVAENTMGDLSYQLYSLNQWYEEQVKLAGELGVSLNLVTRAYQVQIDTLIKDVLEPLRESEELLAATGSKLAGKTESEHIADQFNTDIRPKFGTPDMTLDDVYKAGELVSAYIQAEIAAREATFDELQDLYDDMDKNTESINEHLEGAADAALKVVEQLDALLDQIDETVRSLKYSTLNVALPPQKAEDAAQDYATLLAGAKTGDQEAIKEYLAFTQTYLQRNQDAYKSSDQYRGIYDQVMADIETVRPLVYSVNYDKLIYEESKSTNEKIEKLNEENAKLQAQIDTIKAELAAQGLTITDTGISINDLNSLQQEATPLFKAEAERIVNGVLRMDLMNWSAFDAGTPIGKLLDETKGVIGQVYTTSEGIRVETIDGKTHLAGIKQGSDQQVHFLGDIGDLTDANGKWLYDIKQAENGMYALTDAQGKTLGYIEGYTMSSSQTQTATQAVISSQGTVLGYIQGNTVATTTAVTANTTATEATTAAVQELKGAWDTVSTNTILGNIYLQLNNNGSIAEKMDTLIAETRANRPAWGVDQINILGNALNSIHNAILSLGTTLAPTWTTRNVTELGGALQLVLENARRINDNLDMMGGSYGRYATGGIAHSPQLAYVAEERPEAIIPLQGGAVPVQLSGSFRGSGRAELEELREQNKLLREIVDGVQAIDTNPQVQVYVDADGIVKRAEDRVSARSRRGAVRL